MVGILDLSPAFTGTLKLAQFGIELAQVPAEVSRCVELANTCRSSLLELIGLRNQHKDELHPDKLRRVDEIINAAKGTILELCKIVEKCRPRALSSINLLGRMRWKLVNLAEFTALRPVLDLHHVSVTNASTQITIIVEARATRHLAERDLEAEEQEDRVKIASAEFFHLELIGSIDSSHNTSTEPLQLATSVNDLHEPRPARPPLRRKPVRADTRGGPRFRRESLPASDTTGSMLSLTSSSTVSSTPSTMWSMSPSSITTTSSAPRSFDQRARSPLSDDERAGLISLFADPLASPVSTRAATTAGIPLTPPMTPQLGPSSASNPYYYGPHIQGVPPVAI